MDLVPHLSAPTEPPSLRAFARDHIDELVQALQSRLPELLGHPVEIKRMSGGGVGFDVAPERLLETMRFLRDALGFDLLTCISGVDMIDHLDSVYHLRSLGRNWLLQVRVRVPVEAPEVPSVVSLYAAANWLEREEYDLLGIVYTGHPDLRRIMLDDEFQGHPLRKSFRSTPSVVHDRATTQARPADALAGRQQRLETVVNKRLGQGQDERLHPGTPTFGDMAIFSRTGQGLEPDQNPQNPLEKQGKGSGS